jgi:putative transposase
MVLAFSSITTPDLFLKRPRERLLESFNSKLRDEFLNGEIFYSIKELRVLAERWPVHYKYRQTTHFVAYKPPAPEAWLTNSKGHGEVETATRFPLLTPDGGYLNSEVNALH